MIIDLLEWNEYIADDVPPGPIPPGVQLDIMIISNSTGIKEHPTTSSPLGIKADRGSLKTRFFWKIKK